MRGTEFFYAQHFSYYPFFSIKTQCTTFFFLLLPQIWNIEEEKDREKEKVGGLEREITNRGDVFLLEELHENFVAAVTKWEMLMVTNAR